MRYLKALLLHFRVHNRLGQSVRVRFDVEESETALLRLLGELFPVHQVKRFLHMQRSLDASEMSSDGCVSSEQGYFEQVATVLSVLKQYTHDYLKTLYADKRLYVYCEGGIPLAALHIEPRANGVCEVMTLAADAKKLRRGYATKLLRAFFGQAYPHFSSVYLKVNEQNIGAVNLYHKLGFEIIPERTQQWWYVPM